MCIKSISNHLYILLLSTINKYTSQFSVLISSVTLNSTTDGILDELTETFETFVVIFLVKIMKLKICLTVGWHDIRLFFYIQTTFIH